MAYATSMPDANPTDSLRPSESAEAASRRTPPGRWLLAYGLALVVLVVGSFALSMSGADVGFQRAVYTPGAGWVSGEGWFWKLLYHAGTLPALFVALAALLSLLPRMRWLRPRGDWMASVYIVLVMAIGPGLVANAILKDHWGRPRPRDLVEFGGEYAYEPPMVQQAESTGKSFPCGHATMGFFFFSLFFVHGRRGWRAWTWLGIAVLLGSLIGLARALQGAHFLSDTWWAAGLTWLTCAVLWDLTQWARRRGIDAKLALWGQRAPRWAGAMVIPVCAGLCGGVLLASPWQQKVEAKVEATEAVKPLHLVAALQSGHIMVRDGTDVNLAGEAYGHGSPGGGITSRFKSWTDDSSWQVRLRQARDGWLTECNQQSVLHLPLARVADAYFDLADTRLEVPLMTPLSGAMWTVDGERGTVTLRVPASVSVSITNRSGAELRDETGWFSQGQAAWHKDGTDAEVRIKIVLKQGLVKLVRGTVP